MTDIDGKNIHGPVGEKFDLTIFYGKAAQQSGFTTTNFMGDIRNTNETEIQALMRSDVIIDRIRIEILNAVQTVPTTFAIRKNGVDLFAEVFAALQTHDRTKPESFELKKDDLISNQFRGGVADLLRWRVSYRMRFKAI